MLEIAYLSFKKSPDPSRGWQLRLSTWFSQNPSYGLICKVLSITRKVNSLHFQYHMDSTKLLRVNEEKELGVIITENLSWESHLTCICAKANKLLDLLKRTCISIVDVG